MMSLKSIGQMSRTGGLLFVLLSSGARGTPASAQTLTTLVSFDDANGRSPSACLIADAHGNLFGTTQQGGAYGYGTAFEIVKTSRGYASAPTTLVSFDNTNGSAPIAGLIADANGNLFGTTLEGGAYGYGTVFEIVKTSSGYASTPTTLVSFDNTDGSSPEAGLIADANGNLFGTTAFGGASLAGTAFEIAKTKRGFASTPTTLVSFDYTNAAFPYAGLIGDANGNLFGTTRGAYEFGTAFEIVKSKRGYASTPTTLVSFDNTNGAFPFAGLIADADGNLFGTTPQGGASDLGTVFEIVKTRRGYAGTPTTLVTFDNANGSYPVASLIADAHDNLFGTTRRGGASDLGTVFEIVKTKRGYARTPTTLVSFDNTDGVHPYASLIADANGNLFGTTEQGGASDLGTVFEVTGSGFVPPRQFAGTPGSADCTGKSISTMARTYGGIADAASALGYDSVTALRSAVASYCSN